MSVNTLPDAAPNRVAGAAEAVPPDAPAAAPTGDHFSTALDARMAQRERDDRQGRRPVAATTPDVAAALPALPARPAPLDLASIGLGSPREAGVGGPSAAAAAPLPEGPAGAPPPSSSVGHPPPSNDAFEPSSERSTPAIAGSTPAKPLLIARLAASAGSASGQGTEALARASRPSAPRADDADLALASRVAATAALPAGLPVASPAQGAGAVGPGANPLTAVNRPSSGSLTIADPGRTRLRDAISFVANQAALRRGAVGELEVPELGRVVIRAERGAGGVVDIHIQSDRPETHGLLHASAPAIAADLRDVDVPVGQIQLELLGGGSLPGGRSASGDDIRRGRPGVPRDEKENEASRTRSKRRVRIVL